MNIFEVTERLRKELDVASAIARSSREAAMQKGLSTELYVIHGKKAEYQRGRADGIRLSIETISKMIKAEIEDYEQKSKNKRKTNTLHLS